MRVILFFCLLVVISLQVLGQTDSLLVLQQELKQTQENTQRIAILCNLANWELKQKPATALKHITEAITLQEDTIINKNTIRIYLLLQDALSKTENIEKLAENSLHIANFYQNIQNTTEQNAYLQVAGSSYQRIGNFTKAMQVFYTLANNHQKQNNMLGELEALNAIAAILRIERKLTESATLLTDNLSKISRLNQKTNPNDKLKKQVLLVFAETYNLIGVNAYTQNNLDSALFYWQKSYPLRVEANDSIAIAKSMNNLGLIYRRKGDYSKALHYFSETIKIFLAKDSLLAVPSITNLGLTYSLLKDNENAVKQLEYALKLGIQKKLTTRVLENYEAWVTHYLSIANYQKAYEFKAKVEILKDSLFNENSAKQVATMQAVYETDQHKQAVQMHKIESQNKTNSIYLILIATFFLLVALLVLYNRFSLKKKSNDLLQQQYTEINQQKEELDAQRNYIEEQNNILTKQHTDIISSINYAKRIQTAILPPLEDITKIFPNSFVFFKPKSVVSGDFYWFAQEINPQTKQPNYICAVVDCTGHGVPGAFMSLIGNTLLDEIVHISTILSPELILTELDKRVRKLLKQQEEASQKDGMDLVICNYDKANQQICFAGAMNPFLAIIDQEATLYKGNRFAIGGANIHKETKIFTKNTIALENIQQKATFYLFTDGFQDQFGGKEGKKFMLKNFKNLLQQIHLQPFATQLNSLENTLQIWQMEGKEEQIDDILVIGFEILK